LIFNLISLNLNGQNAHETTGESIYNKLDEYLMSATRLYLFNGTALVAKKGTILLNKGYGWRDVATKTLNDSNSIFQIGSVIKTY
jgi:CubicO group peptidase (beta-lactamase class C family)